MLELAGVTAGYGAFTALWDVSLRVAAGEAVAVVGPNGAGKTTLLRAISGLIAPRSGSVIFEGAELAGHPAYDVVAHGIALVPEGRRLFPQLTVAENLKMGAYLRSARAHFRESLERVYTLFPALAERQDQRAGSLSGGVQQMLAVGRALMSRPKFILLDEPSMGLAPVMVLRLFDLIRRVRAEGYTTWSWSRTCGRCSRWWTGRICSRGDASRWRAGRPTSPSRTSSARPMSGCEA
jgi:branched-chain amino acid transport system ATP-binding protein